jgi:ABC-type uncharacterized transport system substrate-binding protein
LPRFDLLRYRRHDDRVFLYAFDLIELYGDDRRRDPLERRKADLVRVLAPLASYSADYNALWRESAVYVDKILRGSKPADLPVAFPTKFELVINLKTAKALGLDIAPILLNRADEVIE